jgi:hypothetical protein
MHRIKAKIARNSSRLGRFVHLEDFLGSAGAFHRHPPVDELIKGSFSR